MINNKKKYFNWLCDLVGSERYGSPVSYNKLLNKLYDTEFISLIYSDEDRIKNGIDLRYHYILLNNLNKDLVIKDLDGPCSVLELMVSLAVHCEDIMDDPQIGDRTGQWFWQMVVNLGLGSMHDSHYNERVVDQKMDIFLHREYEPNGKGGLFIIENYDGDLRNVDIWYQMCWYLNSIM